MANTTCLEETKTYFTNRLVGNSIPLQGNSSNAMFFVYEDKLNNELKFVKVRVDDVADSLDCDAVIMKCLESHFKTLQGQRAGQLPTKTFQKHFLQLLHAGCVTVDMASTEVKIPPTLQDPISRCFCIENPAIPRPISIHKLFATLLSEPKDMVSLMFDGHTFNGAPYILGASDKYNDTFAPYVQHLFTRLLELFVVMVDLSNKTQFIHNDLHMGNILWNQEEDAFVLIDYGRTYMNIVPHMNVSDLNTIINLCSDSPTVTDVNEYFEFGINNYRIIPEIHHTTPVFFDIASLSMNILRNFVIYMPYNKAVCGKFDPILSFRTIKSDITGAKYEAIRVPKDQSIIWDFFINGMYKNDQMNDVHEFTVDTIVSALVMGVAWFAMCMSFIAATYGERLPKFFPFMKKDLNFYYINMKFIQTHVVYGSQFIFMHNSPIMQTVLKGWDTQGLMGGSRSQGRRSKVKKGGAADIIPRGEQTSITMSNITEGSKHPTIPKHSNEDFKITTKLLNNKVTIRIKKLQLPEIKKTPANKLVCESHYKELYMDLYNRGCKHPLSRKLPENLVEEVKLHDENLRPDQVGGSCDKLRYQGKVRVVKKESATGKRYIVWDSKKLYLGSIQGKYRYV